MSRLYLQNRLVRIDQFTLIPKFVQYLEKTKMLPAQRFSSLARDLIKNGLCFSFAIIHSFYASQGKAFFWEEMLADLSEADPLSEEDAHIFEAVLRYLLPNQFDADILPQLCFDESFSQNSALLPNGFSLFVIGEEVQTIQSHVRISGHFTKEELSLLFDPELFSMDAIFVLSGGPHSISMRCMNNYWFVYDSNQPYGETNFDSLSSCLDFVCDEFVVGTSMSIEIASWRSDELFRSKLEKFSHTYEQIISRNLLVSFQKLDCLRLLEATQSYCLGLLILIVRLLKVLVLRFVKYNITIIPV